MAVLTGAFMAYSDLIWLKRFLAWDFERLVFIVVGVAAIYLIYAAYQAKSPVV